MNRLYKNSYGTPLADVWHEHTNPDTFPHELYDVLRVNIRFVLQDNADRAYLYLKIAYKPK